MVPSQSVMSSICLVSGLQFVSLEKNILSISEKPFKDNPEIHLSKALNVRLHIFRGIHNT